MLPQYESAAAAALQKNAHVCMLLLSHMKHWKTCRNVLLNSSALDGSIMHALIIVAKVAIWMKEPVGRMEVLIMEDPRQRRCLSEGSVE